MHSKDYFMVIYGKREKYAIEYVSTHHRDWHYIIDAHKIKRGEDPYDPSAYAGRILFAGDILLGPCSDLTTPNCVHMRIFSAN